MMNKGKRVALTTLFSFLVLAGCKPITNETGLIEVTDMVGDTVLVKKNPENVAVISRAVADMMVGFGLGDKVDGMYKSILDNTWTSYLYPDSTNYYSYGYQDSAELFVARNVDLVIVPEQYLAVDLRTKGVKAITMNLYGTPTYEHVITKIADLISEVWPATLTLVNEWKGELNTAIAEVTAVTKTITSQKSIYYVRGDKDKGIGYTDTRGALVETVYEKYFKMNYISKDFENANPSVESIMSADPDVIVVGGKFQQKIINDIKNTAPQKELTAVKENRLFNIPLGFVMWEQNSLALPLFLYDQANKLYPSDFNYDLTQKTKDSFSKYFNFSLTTEEVNYMLQGKTHEGE